MGTSPLPKFHFSVEIPDVGVIAFRDASVLDIEPSLVQFRKAKRPNVAPTKPPAVERTGTVTMKRGVLTKNKAFIAWYKSIGENQAKRTMVTITLMDESGNSVMTWKLTNALPTKITSADLDAAGNEVAIESLEIAHDRLTVSNN